MPLPVGVRIRAAQNLFPSPDPYVNDPHGWVTRKCRRWLWSKQREIMESVRDNRYTAVPSCHGPGKSFTASAVAAWWMDVHPPGESFVITTAPTDPQVKAILWKEIKRRHSEAGMSGRITLEAHWYTTNAGVEELVGMGRKPQDYNAAAFQGIHAKYVLVLIDEACGVEKSLFDALETLLTNDYARMLAIGNPDDPASHFETVCRPGSGYNVIPISAYDTPNFTGEFVPTDVAEVLVTPLWVDERKKKWGVTSPLFISKVLAKFPEISTDTLITPNMVRNAQQKTLPGLGMGQYGWDIARLGGDETVGYRNRDGKIRRIYSSHMTTTDVTANAIHMHLNSHGANYVPAYLDVIGLGAGVFDELRTRNLNVVPVNVAEPAFDDKRFANKRAEMYWHLRELFEQQKLDIDIEDEDLAAQLTSIKWNLTRKKAQIYLESKDDMRRRGLPSPDRADGAMLSAIPGSTFMRMPIIIAAPTITDGLLTEVM